MDQNLYHTASAAPATVGPYNFRSRDTIPIPKRLLNTTSEYAPINFSAVPCSGYDTNGQFQPFSTDLKVNRPGCSHWSGATRPINNHNVSSNSVIIDMSAVDPSGPGQEVPFPKVSNQTVSTPGNRLVIHLNFSPYLKARLKTNNSCHFTRHRGVLIRPSTNYRRSRAAFANWAPIIWNQLGDCTAVLNTSLSVKQWANMKISRCSDIATILSSFVGSV